MALSLCSKVFFASSDALTADRPRIGEGGEDEEGSQLSVSQVLRKRKILPPPLSKIGMSSCLGGTSGKKTRFQSPLFRSPFYKKATDEG